MLRCHSFVDVAFASSSFFPAAHNNVRGPFGRVLRRCQQKPLSAKSNNEKDSDANAKAAISSIIDDANPRNLKIAGDYDYNYDDDDVTPQLAALGSPTASCGSGTRALISIAVS